MKKLLAKALAIVMIASAFAGCSGNNSKEAKDTVTVLAVANTETYDPLVFGNFDGWVKNALFDGLVRFDENAKIQPMLAESWEDDGNVVTFHLRKGVKGHDGTEFDADDVIFSMDTKMLEPTNFYIANYVSSWEKVDQYTVNMTKTYPFVNFFEVLASGYGVGLIVSKEAYEAKGAEQFAKEPVGFGPYTVESKGTDGTITMKAFADYWGGKPAFETFVVKAPIDMNTALVGLENNEIDLVTMVPPAQYNTVKNSGNLELDVVSQFGTMQVGMMTTLSKDQNLRYAFAYGINRESVITLATEGTGHKVNDMYSPYTMGELGGQFSDVPVYDPEKAAEYLAKSDYVAGTSIRATVYDPTGVAIAQSIQNDMGKLGVTVQIEQVDINAFNSMLMNGELEIMIVASGGAPIALGDMLMSWESANPVWGPLFAHSDEYDQIIDQMRVEKDPSKITELTKRAIEIQYELCNFIGLYEEYVAVAYSKSITGVHAGTAGVYNYYPQDLKPAGN